MIGHVGLRLWLRPALALLIASCVCGGAHSASLADDPLLSRPVSLTIKGQSLSGVLAELEASTEARLRATEQDVADQKASIFVKDIPLHQVMSSISALFDLEWRIRVNDSGTVYFLRRKEEHRLQRQRALSLMAEELGKRLDEAAELAALPVEEREGRLMEIEKSGSIKAHHFDILKHHIAEPNRAASFGLWESLSDPVKQDLLHLTGTASFNSAARDARWQLPSDFPIHYDPFSWGGIRTEPERTPTGATVDLTVERSDDIIQLRSGIWKSDETGFISGLLMPLVEVRLHQLLPPVELRADPPPEGPLDQPFTLKEEDLVRQAGFPCGVPGQGQPYRPHRTDILALMHERLGVNIVSDHYSHWSWAGIPVGSTGRRVLNALTGKDQRDESMRILWGARGNILLIRAEEALRLDEEETPERLLVEWRVAFRERGTLGLKQLGEISRLSQWRYMHLTDEAPFLGISTTRLMMSQEDRVIEMARLLNGRQWKAAAAGELTTAGMTAAERENLADFLLKHRISPGEPEPPVDSHREGVRTSGAQEIRRRQPPPILPASIAVRDQVIGGPAENAPEKPWKCHLRADVEMTWPDGSKWKTNQGFQAESHCGLTPPESTP